jgi:GH25 family lysozyme M1 (1,4-beta-N-acetylmuramidase)
MKHYGYTVGLYCSESWFTDEIDGPSFDKAGFEIWIAKYSSNKPKHSHDAWQYTDKGKLPGISGSVDLNYFFKNYEAKNFRDAVQQRFGFEDSTMAFLDKHPHVDALYLKLATKG